MAFQKIQTKKSKSYKVSQIHPLSFYKLKRNVVVRIPYRIPHTTYTFLRMQIKNSLTGISCHYHESPELKLILSYHLFSC